MVDLQSIIYKNKDMLLLCIEKTISVENMLWQKEWLGYLDSAFDIPKVPFLCGSVIVFFCYSCIIINKHNQWLFVLKPTAVCAVIDFKSFFMV